MNIVALLQFPLIIVFSGIYLKLWDSSFCWKTERGKIQKVKKSTTGIIYCDGKKKNEWRITKVMFTLQNMELRISVANFTFTFLDYVFHSFCLCLAIICSIHSAEHILGRGQKRNTRMEILSVIHTHSSEYTLKFHNLFN